MAALSLLVAGIFFPPKISNISNIGITLIGAGAALLLAAVVLPAVSQVEFGIPSGFKITALARDREEKLRQVFEWQRPDLETCAKFLCDDPTTAGELLTAAMARATLDWRGPIDPEIRTYVLCWFVHRLTAHNLLAPMEQPATAGDNPLSELTTIQRVVVVLSSKLADVPIEEVADMVGLSPSQAQAELSRAEKVLEHAARRGVV